MINVAINSLKHSLIGNRQNNEQLEKEILEKIIKKKNIQERCNS